MRNLITFLYLFSLIACGVGDTGETYTYVINNNSGTNIRVVLREDIQEVVVNDDSYRCSYSTMGSNGFCQGYLEIRFLEEDKGYRCIIEAENRQGLCFVNDTRVFTPDSDTSIFTETSSNVFEFTITPEMRANAFDLPD